MSLIFNEEVFKAELIKHKKDIAKLAYKIKNCKERKEFAYLFKKIRNHSKELALAFSHCMCIKCKNDKTLQYHHLIMRKAQDYMEEHIYYTQRYYTFNSTILCAKCHREYHKIVENEDNIDADEKLSFKDELILKILNKYFKEGKNGK